jgi:hypothetical protein
MAFPAAEPTAERSPGFGAALLAAYRRFAAKVEAYPLEQLGLAAIAAGVVLRLASPFFMDFRSDGDTYTAMGQAWALHHAFLMPYGDVTTWAPLPPGYSNHYPPLYPFYLGLVFTVFGFGLGQAKWAAVVMSLAALAAVYSCTRDLYGKLMAALATGLLAVEPHLVWVTGSGFSENMVLLFFALTMWAILRSLTDDRYIVWAGLFAGLAYLTRASVGYFFVIAGGGGFLWRFYYRRWRLFTNVWYLAAIGIFLAIAGWWAVRNATLFPPVQQTLFGYTFTVPAWDTSSYTRYVQNLAFSEPGKWGYALVEKIPLFLAFLAWYVVPFLPESWRATKRIREEETSALWLSVFLVWITAWVISAMFWVFEQSSLYWFDNHRYVLIGLLPLAWLLLREARWERASTRLRFGMLLLSLFLACGAVFLDPIRFSDLRAAETMDAYLHPGDQVGVDGSTIKYAFYAYLHHPERIQVYGCEGPPADGNATGPCHGAADDGGHRADFIVSLRYGASYQDYDLVGTFRQHFSDGGVMTATLWARDDVAKARGVPMGLERDYS